MNGYLETTIDWIPGMEKTTDPNDIMVSFLLWKIERSSRALAIILNTFESFENKRF